MVRALSILIAAAALILGCQPHDEDTVNVAVATNFYVTALELETAFEAQSGYDVSITSGSTGQLYAQIINGAPYDIFLAADQKRPARLVEDGLASDQFSYATGRLVLWDGDDNNAPDLDTLRNADYQYLAIANPALAPYGAAAQAVITDMGLSDKIVSHKIVRGENIGQTYSLVQTGNADYGFVSLSQMISAPPTSYWLVPSSLHAPIIQDAVRLTSGAGTAEFYNFLKSERAGDIIKAAGYNMTDGE